MQVKSKTYTMRLEEMPLDVGYASEKVTLKDATAKSVTVGGQDGTTQLFITTPVLDEAFLNELKEIDASLPQGGDYEVHAALIVADTNHQIPELNKFNFYVDSDDEMADFYGLRLTGEPYNGELTKALILVSKDGAIFYDEYLSDIDTKFNIDTLYRKIAAAQLCYTGKGCH